MSNASATSRAPNRTMFWRIVRRLITANRGRLFVILLALAAGAAITAALLNLQIDAKRRLTTEFSAFGPNVVLASRSSADLSNSLEQTLFDQFPAASGGAEVTRTKLLYGIVDVQASEPGRPADAAKWAKAVLVGFAVAVGKDHLPHGIENFSPSSVVAGRNLDTLNVRTCEAGKHLASQLHLHVGTRFSLRVGTRQDTCTVSAIRSFGGPEDDEIFFELPGTQALLGLPGRVSVIEARVPGTPQSIERYITALQKQFPDADVHGVRQFGEAQGKIYTKISGLLTSTVVLVLILTALCVMAAMTNVAMERRNDVGLMKAIGGATRRVLRLFLTEAALLGLAGGVIGAAVGIVLSIGLGKAVFGIAARPRLIVYPISVVLTILVAIVSSYPLRRLANVRPASVFRGEA
jgi:putative ABC transport system permease protein